MDAVKFLKNVSQICSASKGCENECPLWEIWCKSYDKQTEESIDTIVETVEEWAKDHPIKTRQSELLKMFPNTTVGDNSGVITICPSNFDDSVCKQGVSCDDCCREFWLEEVE